jgi:hypothetical protein
MFIQYTQAIWESLNKMTDDEAAFHESLTEKYEVSDLTHLKLGSFDSYLAFQLTYAIEFDENLEDFIC